MNNQFIKDGIKVSIVTIIGNVFLSIFKLIAGWFGKSNAMISDSIHSLSDVLSTIIVLIGLKILVKIQMNHIPMVMKELNASLLLF